MGYSEDDAVHKILHKMKMHLQNQVKMSVMKSCMEVGIERQDVILLQCSFNLVGIALFKGELHLKPNLHMFCVLSQNYQHCFEKQYKHPEANYFRNLEMALKF